MGRPCAILGPATGGPGKHGGLPIEANCGAELLEHGFGIFADVGAIDDDAAELVIDLGLLVKADVVGPICESGDFFCQDRAMPDFQPGDVIALLSAGAYGFVMASNYNTRPLPAEILVDGDQATLVRKRQTLDDVLAGEV